MCGLTAALTTNNNKTMWLRIKIAALHIQDRGIHSVGLFSETFYHRVAGDVPSFFKSYLFDHRPLKNDVFMLHNRAATVGSAGLEKNMHPFIYDNTGVFMHNGTLLNHSEFKGDFVPVGDTDSEILGYNIHTGNYSVLDKYKGAAAFVYYNKTRPGEFLVFRGESSLYPKDNKIVEERPLYMAKTPEGVLFCSTIEALVAATDEQNIQKLPANTLMRINNQGTIEVVYNADRSRMYQKEIPYSAPVSGYGAWGDSWDVYSYKYKTNGITESAAFTAHKKKPHAKFPVFYKGVYVDEQKKSVTGVYKLYNADCYFYQGYLVKNETFYNELVEKKIDFEDVLFFSQNDKWLKYLCLSAKHYLCDSGMTLFIVNNECHTLAAGETRTLFPMYALGRYILTNKSVKYETL